MTYGIELAIKSRYSKNKIVSAAQGNRGGFAAEGIGSACGQAGGVARKGLFALAGTLLSALRMVRAKAAAELEAGGKKRARREAGQ